jgi:DNA-binding NarL/FixJ family response regulator
MLRILVADDHDMVRRGIRDIIENHPGWMICAEASDGHQVLELAQRESPDIAIVDVSLPFLNGVAVARLLQKECPKIHVLLFTMHDDDETVGNALAAGIRGYVLKSDTGASLEAAISALQGNRLYFSSSISERMLFAALNERQKTRLETFTTRELEVAQLIAEGRGNKEIARLLMIGIKTVESHRAAAMRKAGVQTAAALVRFAIKHKMIAP